MENNGGRLLDEFEKERYEVFSSMDEKMIKEYCKNHNIDVPENEEVFWAAVHKVICNMYLSGNSPISVEQYNKSYNWLIANGFTPYINDEDENTEIENDEKQISFDISEFEEIENTLEKWEQIVKEDDKPSLSNFVETVLLYICAITEKVSDNYLKLINFFASSEYTKEEIIAITKVINEYGSDRYYFTPAFILRMMSNDINKIEGYITPSVSVSDEEGIAIEINSSDEEIEEDINFESLNTIFMLIESVVIGYDINPYALPESKKFISFFKTFINDLLETDSFLFTKEYKNKVLKILNNIDFDKHDNNVELTDKEMSKIENNFKSFAESLKYKDHLNMYIQNSLINLWSSNESLNENMLNYYNCFGESLYSSEQVLSAMTIMEEEDGSCLLPFDFTYIISNDQNKDTDRTRKYISLMKIIFIYSVYLNNTLYIESKNIIEKAINSLTLLCDNNEVVKNEISKQLENIADQLFEKLKNEIRESEEKNNNGIYDDRNNIIKENRDNLFFNIIDYSKQIGCITEEEANKYLSMPVWTSDEFNVIKKMFKDSLKNADYDTIIELTKYIQKYVKRFYYKEDKSSRKQFIENILDDLLNYVSFYDPRFVKKVSNKSEEEIEFPEVIIYKGKQYFETGNFEQSIIKHKSLIKDLILYPIYGEYKYFRGIELRGNMLKETSAIIEKTFIANQVSLTDEFIQLLKEADPDSCKLIIEDFFTYLKYKKIIMTSSQVELLLKLANPIKHLDLYIDKIIENIKAEKLDSTDEMFQTMYEYDSNLFNKIFNSLVLDLKNNGRRLSNQQIELLSKWISYTNNKEFYDFSISNKGKYFSEEQNDYIQKLIDDIVQNENTIIDCIRVLNDKDQIYYIIELIIKNVDDVNNDHADCLFRILNNDYVRDNLKYFKLLNDDNSINKLINMVREYNQADENSISVFMTILDELSRKGNTNKKSDIIKKLIDNKPIFANHLIKKIILNLGKNSIPKYIEEIIEYANNKKVDLATNTTDNIKSNLSYKDIYDFKIETDKIKTNTEINLTDYFFNVNSNILKEDIEFINQKVSKLFRYNINENEFDFEKVIEHIIKNKDFFLHKETVGKMNYAEWFFEGVKKINSEESLNKLINNKFIVDDIYNNIEVHNDYYIDITYKDYYGEIKLKNNLIEILVMRFFNKEVRDLINKFESKITIVQEKEDFIKAKELIEQCYNEDNYRTEESIKKLNDYLIDNLKNPYSEQYMPYCTFYIPNMIYLLFLTKACEVKYDFVCQILNQYTTEENGFEAIDVIIYELYKKYGISTIEKIMNCDDNVKKLYFGDVYSKVQLVLKISGCISNKDAITMIGYLMNNTDDENTKYRFIKKLLSSTNYRELISLAELEYINTIVKDINDEKLKHELMHKCELLSNSLCHRML